MNPHPSDQRPGHGERIAIIGGGFSGAATAYHLARGAPRPMEITIFEPRNRLGRGIAYSAFSDHLLLNVPAEKLSIDPDTLTDFADWCRASGRRVDAGAFLPRAWFGEYIESRLAEAVERSAGRVILRTVPAKAKRIDDIGSGLVITADDGSSIEADHAVLAMGHGPTRAPGAIEPFLDSEYVLQSPWDVTAMSHVARSAGHILLVGAGLTMCDAATSLLRLGFKGKMTAVSRRGLLPGTHGPSNPGALGQWRDELSPGSLRRLRQAVKTAVRRHGWRSAIDALRPRTAELWGALNRADQVRFLHRLAPYWDARRHRMPTETASAIQSLQESGVLRVLRGHIRNVRLEGTQWSCELIGAGHSSAEPLHVDRIILCTGPEPDPSRWDSPLIDGMLSSGLASLDPLKMGLKTTFAGLLIGRGDAVQQRLSTIGPLRRGSLWESTAVPELSQQAQRLAAQLLPATR